MGVILKVATSFYPKWPNITLQSDHLISVKNDHLAYFKRFWASQIVFLTPISICCPKLKPGTLNWLNRVSFLLIWCVEFWGLDSVTLEVFLCPFAKQKHKRSIESGICFGNLWKIFWYVSINLAASNVTDQRIFKKLWFLLGWPVWNGIWWPLLPKYTH